MATPYKYLDKDGLLYLWNKIKAHVVTSVSTKADGISFDNDTRTLSLKSGTNVISTSVISGGTGGTTNYADLINKPTINGVSLTGNKTTSDLGITVPTKTSDLTNDSTFQTSSQVNASIASAIADVTQFDFQIVEELAPVGQKGVIYLVATGGTTGQDLYKEYIWITDKYEEFGAPVDLSGYLKVEDMSAITNAEIDALVG